jgi:hypothetical protein
MPQTTTLELVNLESRHLIYFQVLDLDYFDGSISV